MNVAEETIKQKITAAMDEPAVPPEVVERALDRVNAVLAGREAEKQLASLGAAASGELKTELAAKAITGKLLSNRKPPRYVTSDMMTRQLTEDKSFRGLTSGDPVRLAQDIRSGEIFRKLADSQAQKENAAPQAETPELRLESENDTFSL